MTLLEILLHELEDWPEGKEYAFQSTSNSSAFFASSAEDEDDKAIYLCQIASNRGIDHKVTHHEWQTAKIKSLPFFPEVAAVLGEEGAVKELLAVGEISYKATELDEAFAFAATPQGFDFWKDISELNRWTNKLKHALNFITEALNKANPDLCIRLESDGSGSVRDRDDNEVLYFANPEFLVNELLSPAYKFEHWDLLHDRFQWVAKDRNGDWWAYEDRPIKSEFGWKATGECRSLDIMKVEIPCHWKNSLIKRPTSPLHPV